MVTHDPTAAQCGGDHPAPRQGTAPGRRRHGAASVGHVILRPHLQERVPQPAADAAHVGGRGDRHRRLPLLAHLHRRPGTPASRGRRTDRVIVRNKISITFDRCRSTTSTRCATSSATRARSRTRTGSARSIPRTSTASSPTSPPIDDVFKMYPEVEIEPEQWKAYMEDRAGRHRRAAPGREVRLEGRRQDVRSRAPSIPATGTSTCAPSTQSNARSVDESTMFFHWKYFNERQLEARKDHVGLIFVKVNDASQSTAARAAHRQELRQLAGRDAHREREGVPARVPVDGVGADRAPSSSSRAWCSSS